MSGHSKWSTIRHKKAAADNKRGKIFTKLVREITVAAKSGGGDLDSNPRLRMAVLAAKENNMPADNIERAIKKGTGELEGQEFVEITYEGYAPAGVALLVESLTDNKNRTGPEVRTIFSKKNGSIGEVGCVGWMFQRTGLIVVKQSAVDEDALMELVLESGADDMSPVQDTFEIKSDLAHFQDVKEALAAKGIAWELAEMTMLPSSTVQVTSLEEARKILDLVEALEDHDDVQNVYANFEFSDDVLAQLEG